MWGKETEPGSQGNTLRESLPTLESDRMGFNAMFTKKLSQHVKVVLQATWLI